MFTEHVLLHLLKLHTFVAWFSAPSAIRAPSGDLAFLKGQLRVLIQRLLKLPAESFPAICTT